MRLFFTKPTQPRAGAPSPLPRLRAQYRLQPVRPIGTYVFLALNLLLFLAVTLMPYLSPSNAATGNLLFDWGMKVNERIARGEYWRLFTAMFLHSGELHFFSNFYSLLALGVLVEGYFGHLRFLGIYLLGGLFGSLASYAFTAAPSVGASGAIFALVGALTLYFLRYHENFGDQGRNLLINMLLALGLNLGFGLTVPYIDNWGHIGGLLGGLLIAAGLLPRYKKPLLTPIGVQTMVEQPKVLLELGWMIVCSLLLLLGIYSVPGG